MNLEFISTTSKRPALLLTDREIMMAMFGNAWMLAIAMRTSLTKKSAAQELVSTTPEQDLLRLLPDA